MHKVLDGSGGCALVWNFANYIDSRSTTEQHVEFYLQRVTIKQAINPTCLTHPRVKDSVKRAIHHPTNTSGTQSNGHACTSAMPDGGDVDKKSRTGSSLSTLVRAFITSKASNSIPPAAVAARGGRWDEGGVKRPHSSSEHATLAQTTSKHEKQCTHNGQSGTHLHEICQAEGSLKPGRQQKPAMPHLRRPVALHLMIRQNQTHTLQLQGKRKA